MNEKRVDVTVLVPVLDEEHHLRAVIAAMLAQSFGGTAEFLFIDGGSRDRSGAILREHAEADPRVRVLHNPTGGIPEALNIGLRAARGRFVARMDAHAHYPSGYLQLGIERLERGDVVSVSGPQLAAGDGRWSRRVSLALASPLGVGGAKFRRVMSEEIEVDSGFTGMWRRADLVAHGGWDEAWANDEDLELAARLREGGGRIVCLPAMAASYVPRDSVLALARQYWRYGFYRVKTSRRHPTSLRPSQLLPPMLMLTLAGTVGPLRRIARPALALYGVAVAASTVTCARRAGLREAAPVPVVYATMHLAYGSGFLGGCIRWGLPSRALLAVLRSVAGRRG